MNRHVSQYHYDLSGLRTSGGLEGETGGQANQGRRGIWLVILQYDGILMLMAIHQSKSS